VTLRYLDATRSCHPFVAKLPDRLTSDIASMNLLTRIESHLKEVKLNTQFTSFGENIIRFCSKYNSAQLIH